MASSAPLALQGCPGLDQTRPSQSSSEDQIQIQGHGPRGEPHGCDGPVQAPAEDCVHQCPLKSSETANGGRHTHADSLRAGGSWQIA